MATNSRSPNGDVVEDMDRFHGDACRIQAAACLEYAHRSAPQTSHHDHNVTFGTCRLPPAINRIDLQPIQMNPIPRTLLLASVVVIAAAAVLSAQHAASSPDWPRWRGAGFDGTAATASRVFARPFDLKVRWKRALGA